MPLLNYRQDFSKSSPHVVADFDAINTQCASNTIIAKHCLSQQEYIQAINGQNQDLRNPLYLNAGVFIANYSNVLIALWDGAKSKGIGGTQEIVAYKCGVSLPEALFHNIQQSCTQQFDGGISGIVQHIAVTRLEVSKQQTSADNTCLKFKSIALPNQQANIHESVVQYSYKDFAKSSNPIAELIAEEFYSVRKEIFAVNEILSKSESLQNTKKQTVASAPERSSNSLGLGQFDSLFTTCDNLSQIFQRKYRWRMLTFVLCCLIALIGYEVFSNYVNDISGIAIKFIVFVFLIAAWGLIKLSKRNKYKSHYRVMRSITEVFRLRAFLNVANVEPDHAGFAPLLSRRFRQRLPIINHCARLAELEWWQLSSFDLKVVKESWLKGQIDFLRTRNSKEIEFDSFSSRINQFLYKRPQYALEKLTTWAKRIFDFALFLGVLLLDSQLFTYLASTHSMNDTVQTLNSDIF